MGPFLSCVSVVSINMDLVKYKRTEPEEGKSWWDVGRKIMSCRSREGRRVWDREGTEDVVLVIPYILPTSVPSWFGLRVGVKGVVPLLGNPRPLILFSKDRTYLPPSHRRLETTVGREGVVRPRSPHVDILPVTRDTVPRWSRRRVTGEKSCLFPSPGQSPNLP